MTMAIEESQTIALQPIESKLNSAIDDEDESERINSDSDGLSAEPGSPVENDQINDEIPDGDTNDDLHALLAYSKNRLAAQEAAPPVLDDGPAEITDDDDELEEPREAADVIQRSHSEEEQLAIAKAKMAEAEAKAAADDDEMEALREEARRAQALTQSGKENTVEDTEKDPAHLLKLAEEKVRQAEEKAREDEQATGVNVIKPTVSTTKRSEANSELWALLNYSKVRLETGATPQLGKKRESTRDDVSVSSKGTKKSVSSKASKKSIASHSVGSSSKAPASADNSSVKNDEGAMDGIVGDDVPFPDVTGDNASVDGSVSGDDEQESLRDESDEEDSVSDESEEEEDELPSFLKNDSEEEEMDPEEIKRQYEEAKFKAASILSVDENLTEVQMLQAMAIAVEAANNGEEKFSTKRSLFRLNEAKLDDLKSFLDFSGKARVAEQNQPPKNIEKEQVGWGIGRGRLIKKLGAAFQDLKVKCDEIDERKQKERQGQMSHTEMFNAAFDDLRKQIDEYEKIVKSKK